MPADSASHEGLLFCLFLDLGCPMHQEKLADVGLPPTLFLQRKHNDSLKKSKRMDNEWAWFQWVPGCFCLLLPTQPTGITIPGMEQLIKSAMLFFYMESLD